MHLARRGDRLRPRARNAAISRGWVSRKSTKLGVLPICALVVTAWRYKVFVHNAHGAATEHLERLHLSSEILSPQRNIPVGMKIPNEGCPVNCEDLFLKLRVGFNETLHSQNVEVQVRGEPKSGTGMMQGWAWGALAHTCRYLQQTFGKRSCKVKWHEEKGVHESIMGKPHSIVFEPRLAEGDDDAKCTCTTIDRVRIYLSAVGKHRLPVSNECGWAHPRAVTNPKAPVCRISNGGRVKDTVGLWKCVEDNACKINDDRLQLAILRDPRAVTVSSYYNLVRQEMQQGVVSPAYENVDAFFTAHLAPISKWLSLRYFLFGHVLADRSALFFYEETTENPVEWHWKYLAFIGLNIPPARVEEAARDALKGGAILGFPSKALDKHPGGGGQNTTRTFRAELTERSLSVMDDVLRVWLPVAMYKMYGLLPS